MGNEDSIFSGDLAHLKLGDVIQFVVMSGLTGELKFTRSREPGEGSVFFDTGEAVSARLGQRSGKEAFYSLFAWLDGHFHFFPGRTEKERNINKLALALVMDAVRMLDEGLIKPERSEDPEQDQPFMELSPDILEEVVSETSDDDVFFEIYVVGEETYKDGDTIFHEGRFSDWVYVVLDGEVRMLKKGEKREIVLAELGKGEIFGEMAFLERGMTPRSASAIANGPVKLGILDKEAVSMEFYRLPPYLRELITGLNRKVRRVTDSVVDFA